MSNQKVLCHYGVLGMKWGRRKNRYGALTNTGQAVRRSIESEYDKLSNVAKLTPAGVRRRADLEKKYQHLTGLSISDRNLVARPKAKTVSEMTNEELIAYNTRKQLETTYLNYQPKPRVSRGKQFATAVGKKIILPMAVDVGRAYLTSLGVDKATGKDMTEAANRAAEAARKAAEKAAEKSMKQLGKA